MKIGWFSTGRDEAARQLLTVVHNEIQEGKLKAEILFVFCNRGPSEAEETSQFFKLVGSYHLHLIYYSSRDFQSPRGYEPRSDPWRLEYDREVMKRLAGFHPDLCVLAGYMLIVDEEMCQKYKMINLHPAAPGGPTGSWQEVIWQLIENRVERTGVMMHLVTPELDKGPAVTYCTLPIRGKPFDRYWKKTETRSLEEIRRREGENNLLFKEIRKHGLAREFPLIVATLKAFSEGRVRIEGGRIVDADGKVINGYDLTEEIDAAIKGEI